KTEAYHWLGTEPGAVATGSKEELSGSGSYLTLVAFRSDKTIHETTRNYVTTHLPLRVFRGSCFQGSSVFEQRLSLYPARYGSRFCTATDEAGVSLVSEARESGPPSRSGF
ncbi:MAG: hypothetical protein QOK48_3305, partial [Blastocatellia bacterium]|nr:hypothetical protein [Blastocatellia bacterium]